MNLLLEHPHRFVPFGQEVEIQPHTSILITGASGFVGSRLAEVLIKQFQCRVFALVRDYSKAMKISHLPINFIGGDLRNTNWEKELPVELDYVFHFAYGSSGSSGERMATDIQGSEQLVRLAASRAVRKIVFLSTISVYRPKAAGKITEQSPLKPGDQYGKNKLAAESALIRECEKHRIPYTIFRPSAILGPGAPSYGNRIFKEIREAEIVFLNQGRGLLNWIFVDDVVRASVHCLFRPESNNKLYVLSNHTEPITYLGFYEKMAEMLGSPLHSRFLDLKENEKVLRNAKPRVLQILLGAIDRKKLRPLLQHPVIGWFLKLLLPKIRRFRSPKPKAAPSIGMESKSRKLLPVQAEYCAFMVSEAVYQSEFLMKDRLLDAFCSGKEVFEAIDKHHQWANSWMDE